MYFANSVSAFQLLSWPALGVIFYFDILNGCLETLWRRWAWDFLYLWITIKLVQRKAPQECTIYIVTTLITKRRNHYQVNRYIFIGNISKMSEWKKAYKRVKFLNSGGCCCSSRTLQSLHLWKVIFPIKSKHRCTPWCLHSEVFQWIISDTQKL